MLLCILNMIKIVIYKENNLNDNILIDNRMFGMSCAFSNFPFVTMYIL